MVKLTPELVQNSAQFINAVRDRELDLRGYKIPVIENLGATLDQFDCIDLSDNDIRKVDGFPLLKRLRCLLLNNNRVCRVAENLEENLPKLEEVILTNNSMQELGDLDPLASIKTLRVLSLLRNPVTSKRHYRLYVINKIPQLQLLDFQKVKMKEREQAKKLFKGQRGQQLVNDLGRRSKTFVPGGGLSSAEKKGGPSQDDIAAIREAIANAKTLEEAERLSQILRTGQVPGREKKRPEGSGAAGGSEVEEMDED
ncbi:U2 small nuclear ribonucleoprotein A'-like [Ptychodera flava]|uniref:U2 small nuclear ribonucleoprotein A'-like n=1 Tax=Ptychodera flava TaxID=63121 RepID=UPI00396A96F3